MVHMLCSWKNGLTSLSGLCRYFAESSATLACMVFGVRDSAPADATPMRDYWITDGALARLLP